MAEAIARQDAPDVIAPTSAGVAALGFVMDRTKQALAANGYRTEGLESKPLNDLLWDSADLVINMTGRPSELVFRGFAERSKVEDWLVRDPYGGEAQLYQQICQELQERINRLAARLREAQGE
jgi:protein-tyrosine-phosphatase